MLVPKKNRLAVYSYLFKGMPQLHLRMHVSFFGRQAHRAVVFPLLDFRGCADLQEGPFLAEAPVD